jgi:two-component system, OmpR family, copper resistance phosphate regulon response regulator CusR
MKLLVIEDDPKTAALMSKGLSSEGFGVEVCLDGEEGLDLAQTSQPDAIILDVMLPTLDGWAVLKRLRESGVNTPVIMLTARDAVEHRVKGLTLGADDYITKPFAFSELLARIRSVLRRSKNVAVEELSYSDLVIDQKRHRVTRAGQQIELSSKEFALLQLLMEHQGEVLTRTFIAERVWGMMYDGDSNVADVNIRRIRAKIDDPHAKKLIQTVRGRGYVIR